MSEIAVQPDDSTRPLPRALDVSHLPAAAFDHHEPAWWGNLLAILIETTTLSLAIASYFYLRRNFDAWPPPRVDQLPFMPNPNPDLLWGTLNFLLLLGSVVPMVLTDKAARRKDRPEVMLWLGVMILVSLLANAIRFVEFRHLNVRWDLNAYGSLVWMILLLHVTYLISAALEFFIMWLWVTTKELDDHHAMDITLAAIYWYWIIGTWLILYIIVYLGARIL